MVSLVWYTYCTYKKNSGNPGREIESRQGYREVGSFKKCQQKTKLYHDVEDGGEGRNDAIERDYPGVDFIDQFSPSIYKLVNIVFFLQLFNAIE
jgi:hypothetical protein